MRLRIAAAYKSLGYPDLAAGDAYKALLLVDEAVEEGEYHEQASEAAQSYIVSGEASEYAAEIHQAYSNFDHSGCRCQSPASSNDEGDDAVSWAKDCWSRTAFALLVGCLTDCGCLRSAFDYNGRALKAFGQVQPFDIYQRTLTERLRLHFESTGEKLDDIDIKMYPDKGVVRRELYPWNKHEPDRYSDETILFLNKEMTAAAPKLEIKVAELPVLSSGSSPMDQDVYYVKQLGVFAKEDIPADEIILQEKSLLTAVSRLHELYCNACSGSLPKPDPNTESVAISCEECEDVFFCSEECHDFAQEQYHPVLCGVSTEQKVPPNEAADWLYTLLLVRALALAEVQDVHPLDLKEVGYIWGDYHGLDLDEAWKADADGHLTDPFASVKQALSFSFNNNILLPLNMLEKMDVNIFEQSHRYDTWIFNTLYAKFRGTASARHGLDGRPEIAAVHPLWCLANHSCDPNVSWEWQGSIKFWTRAERVNFEGRDPPRKPGIRKGEELLSHYCDIRLPVKERREWAAGALGGMCMCARCVWEEAEEGLGGAEKGAR